MFREREKILAMAQFPPVTQVDLTLNDDDDEDDYYDDDDVWMTSDEKNEKDGKDEKEEIEEEFNSLQLKK